MPRTTATDVMGVLMADYDTVNNPSLVPFMTPAGTIVDRVVALAADRLRPLVGSEAATLETWLTAHFYVMSDQPYSQKTTNRASASFQGQTGMGLEASKYGQAALLMDTSGALSIINKRQVAGGFWLGKVEADQIAYEDRTTGY